MQAPRTGSPLSPSSYRTTTFLVLTFFPSFSRFLRVDLFCVIKKVLTCRPQRTRYILCFFALSFAHCLPYIPPIPSAWCATLCMQFSPAFTHFFTSFSHRLPPFQALPPIVLGTPGKGRRSTGPLMPSYTYTRGIPPPKKKETLDEVKARIKSEVENRTTARVTYWDGLAEWCNSKPGRFVRANGNTIIDTADVKGGSLVEIPD